MSNLIPTTVVASEEEKAFEEVIVRVTRTAKVVAGGKRLRFSALAVVGNRSGKVGWGYGKAHEVPFAVEKSIRNAKRNIIVVPLAKNHTLPHTVDAKFKSTRVLMRPASVGTGLKCGASVRAILELAGVKDALSKVYGSANPLNTVKAAFEALRRLRDKDMIEYLRGVKVTGSVPTPLKEIKKREAPVVLPQTDMGGSSVSGRGRGRGRGSGGWGGPPRGDRGRPPEPRPEVKPPEVRPPESQPKGTP